MSDKQSLTRWLIIVLIVSGVLRFILWWFYPIAQTSDSDSYFQLARSILNKGLAEFNPLRTPGYPAFLAITNNWTYLAQLLLGITTTLLLFYIGYRVSRRAWFGGVIALAHTLNLGQLFFEAYLLTESLSTFLVVLSLAIILKINNTPPLSTFYSPFSTFLFPLLLSLLLAALGLTRPLFVFLPILAAIYLFIRQRNWIQSALVMLPALIIIGLWVGYVYDRAKIMSFDILGGYRMMNHVGMFFEDAPDEYAAIRDVYIRYRDQKIAATGTQANTIWDAAPEMMAVSGWNFARLSRELNKIAIPLIVSHPREYALNVIEGWLKAWAAAIYWSPESIDSARVIDLIRGVILIERAILILVNTIFVIASIAILIVKPLRDRMSNPLIWFLAALIWAASIAQALMEHGDNQRFLVPLQSLIVLVVLFWGTRWNINLPTDVSKSPAMQDALNS
jgi:hypothetical protein